MMSNAERNQERDRKCVYVCHRRERALQEYPKKARDGGPTWGEAPGYKHTILIPNHTHIHILTKIHSQAVWGRHAIKQNSIELELSYPDPI